MKIFIFIIIGIAGGIIGGMGMGGGTLTIPLLLIFTSLDQHAAQAINLAAFIPMSIIALVIHFKNRLLKVVYALYAAIPAAVIAVFASILAAKVKAERLSLYFGIFLLLLGAYQLIDLLIKKFKKKKKE